MFWMKSVFMVFITIVCLAIASIPEVAMWFGWHLVNPTEGWERLVLVALFFLGGFSITVFAWFLSGVLWFTCFASMVD